MGSRWLYRILHWILYTVATIIVVCAVIFTITRAFTPYLTLHRATFERWATQLLGAPVKVKKVAFGWRGIEPEMWLQGVSIYQPGTHKQISHINDLYVAISINRSLVNRQVIPDVITLSGAKLSIKQLPNHQYQINDMNIDVGAGQKTTSIDAKSLETWLLNEPHIYLKKIKIAYTNLKKQTYKINLKELGFTSDGQYHQLNGEANVEQKDNKPLHGDFVIQAKGDLLDYQHLIAKFYLKFNNAILPVWFSSTPYAGYWLHQGIANGQLWMKWRDQHIDDVSSQLNVYNLQLHSAMSGKWFNLKSISGDFAWRLTDSGWQFSADKLALITPQLIWPQIQLLAQKNHSNEQLWLNYANLSDVNNFLSGSNLVSANARTWIKGLNASGEIDSVAASIDKRQQSNPQWQLSAALRSLSINHYRHIPGVTHISGKVSANNKSGVFHLNSRDVGLDFGNLFRQKPVLTQLFGDLNWHTQTNGAIVLNGHNLTASNNDLAIVGRLGLAIPVKKTPYISILAGFNITSPAVAKKYLPASVLPKNTLKWLDNAFVGGGALQGKLMLRGKLSQFPFLYHKGVFIVDSKINDLQLHYGKNWPDLQHINGDLLFDGNSMNVNVKSAKLFDATLSEVNATIPALSTKHPQLNVKGIFTDNAGDVMRFLNESPLQKTIGKDLKPLKIQGGTRTQLELMMPLNNPALTKVKGQVKFKQTSLLAPDWHIAVNNINGDLGFTNNTLSSDDLTGEFLGSPITVHFNTIQDHYPVTQITASASTTVKQILKAFKLPTFTYLDGQLNYQTQLNLHMDSKDQRKNSVTIHSDLLGLAVNLPPPFGKQAQQLQPTKLQLFFRKSEPFYLFADYGHILSAALLLSNHESAARFYSANLRFGGAAAQIQAKPSILIDGYLPTFDWKQWQPIILKQHSATPSTPFLQFLKHQASNVNLKVGSLKFKPFDLAPAQVTAKRLQHLWQVGVNSQSVDGYVDIADSYPKTPLIAVFKNLKIPAMPAGSKTKLKPSDIPPLDLTVTNFSYKKSALHNIYLSLRSSADKLTINKITANSPNLKADLHGYWQQDKNHQNFSKLVGSLESNNLHALYKELGIHSNIIAGKTAANIDIYWPGDLFSASVDNLVGDVNLIALNGWILDLGQSATKKLNLGKLITLLSVRHLLMFHFSDLSRNGYSFDRLATDLHFNSGLITTNNLEAEGAVADIKAKGLIDLKRKYLNLWVGIDTNLGASLPIVATIAGGPIFGPIAGAATWIIGKVVHTEVRKHSGYGYHIIGPWDHPKIKEIGAKEKNA